MTHPKAPLTLAEANALSVDVSVHASQSIADLVADVKSSRLERGKSTPKAKRLTLERRAVRAIKYGA